MSEATTSQRVEFTHDEMQSNAELYAVNRPLVDAITKSGDNATDYISHVAEIVDSLRGIANTKAQFSDVKRILTALLKSGWEGSTSQDIERAEECAQSLDDQYERGKGLFKGDMFGAISAAGVAAICLGKVESDAKVRDRFAQMGKV